MIPREQVADITGFQSILNKDTIKEEREQIIKNSLDCGGGCDKRDLLKSKNDVIQSYCIK